MKKKIIIILAIGFFMAACGTPIIQETQLFPEETDFLYSQMLLTLQELGWTIKHTDKASLTILAETVSTGKKGIEGMAGVFGGGNTLPYQASVVFQREDGETVLNLNVTQPGFRMGKGWSESWKKKIMAKFNEKVKR